MTKELLHFTADWCQPCKIAKPIVVEYLAKYPEVVYTVIDIDKDKELMSKYQDLGIMSVPSFVGVVDGSYTMGHAGVPTTDILNLLLLVE